jgi:hypothetical protein
MYTMSNKKSRTKKIIVAVSVVLILAFGLLLGVYLLAGRDMRSGLWQMKHLVRAILDHASITASNRGEFTNVIFLHHSTGDAMINGSPVRELFTEAGFDFWDHNYNWVGLARPDGSKAGYSYRIPNDNTDPDGLVNIFAQRVHSLPLNALSGLLQHEVIIFKSCFPASNITSDEQLEQYKVWYRGMRDVMDSHLDRVFIVMSPPPLNPAATTPEAAARARAFADWLTSDEYLDGHPNIYVFDFFDNLAEDNPTSPEVNILRAEYRPEGEDSHPNEVANATVGPIFAKAVMDAAANYRETGNTRP